MRSTFQYESGSDISDSDDSFGKAIFSQFRCELNGCFVR